MNLGTSIISKEVRDKNSRFSFNEACYSYKDYDIKAFGSLTSLVITNVAYFTVAASIMASHCKNRRLIVMKIFFMISFTLFFVQLIFLALGIIISVVVPKIKSVLPVSLGTVFAFFIIGMLTSTTGDESKRYIISL